MRGGGGGSGKDMLPDPGMTEAAAVGTSCIVTAFCGVAPSISQNDTLSKPLMIETLAITLPLRRKSNIHSEIEQTRTPPFRQR